MSPLPDRPFVPHRTPKTARPAVAQSEFRLSKPFVPGRELPRIDQFLRREDLSRETTADSIENAYEVESLERVDELPPIEHFIDPLPEIAALAPRSDQVSYAARENAVADYALDSDRTTEGAETDWVETDWQQYDWRSAAALGESDVADVEASNAWATTDWDARPPAHMEHRQSAADAIANALDQIAERIRNGDLAIPSPGAATDPATIATTLAALLGVRR